MESIPAGGLFAKADPAGPGSLTFAKEFTKSNRTK
jgi:hypothetical protein